VFSTVIVIPCYNEEQRLAVDEFAQFARASEASLLFVNDGSRDRTAAVISQVVSESSGRIGSLALAENQGKGAAVRAGLNEAIARGADVVAYLDADLSTPLAEIERLIAVRDEAGVDVVLGSRVGLLGHQIRRSALRHYLGRTFATAASLVLGQPVYDTQCGAKVFRVSPELKQALAEPFLTRWVFDVELLERLFAADQAIRCLEVPLHEWRDVDGSKLTPGRMLLAAWELLSLRPR
jgi:glycosyltransferase involved in cell wall biosynthesis